MYHKEDDLRLPPPLFLRGTGTARLREFGVLKNVGKTIIFCSAIGIDAEDLAYLLCLSTSDFFFKFPPSRFFFLILLRVSSSHFFSHRPYLHSVNQVFVY